jgi:zinc transport system substrate-binding protein
MKKLLFFIILISILGVSCTSSHSNKKGKVVFVSILPLKYFTNKIAGNLYQTEVMVPPGVGPETYSPTPKQMRALGQSNAFFAIGYLGFEADLLEKLPSLNPKLKLFNVSRDISLIQENEEKHEDHVHLKGVDPHIWSSPKEAMIIAKNIYDGLAEVDPGNKEQYFNNLQKLQSEIQQVDSTVTQLLTAAPSRKFVIFHPALGYLARDYNLDQFAIEFEGKVPSPKHMQELLEVAKKEKISTVFIQKEFDKRNAEIVAQELGAKVIQIDPLDYNWPQQMIAIASALAGKTDGH